MRLHNDEPTLFDQLSRLDLVRRVGNDVATCDPPHVFGIHGDWGAGKTSFLHQLQAYLTGTCPQQTEDRLLAAQDGGLSVRKNTGHVTVVWFEAWRYQHEQSPIVALLQEIRAQLPWYSKALAEASKLSEVTIRSALLLFEDLTKKIGVQSVSKIQEVGERWEQENLATVLPSHMIRQHLEHALSTLLGDNNKGRKKNRPRLVVIVDDLDRCDAEAAYKLLEGIKIYLNLPNCVFVLGMNQRIIEVAIAKHLPEAGSDILRALRAREYLEKICHSIEHLPAVREPARLLQGYTEGLADARLVCDILSEYGCLPANPRKIKAFANLLRHYIPRFSSKLVDPQTAEDSARLIAIFACLYHFHPEIYRLLEVHPRFYEQIRRWARLDGTLGKHPILDKLERSEIAVQTDASATTPTAEPMRVSAYADPSEGNVFRIQGLIAAFRPVPSTEVCEYLV